MNDKRNCFLNIRFRIYVYIRCHLIIMLIKIIYLLVFATVDIIVYLKLNKSNKLSDDKLWAIGSIFLIFLLLNTGVVSWGFLMPHQSFFGLIVMSFVPILVYVWFKYIVVKRVTKLTMPQKNKDFALKVFSIFFLPRPGLRI